MTTLGVEAPEAGTSLVRELRSNRSQIPKKAGIYRVDVPDGYEPEFLDQSPASWFKGKDPTVSVGRLRSEWVDGTDTIYVGTASKSLYERLAAFIRFSDGGQSVSVGHWGGRLVWQLSGSGDFRIRWEVDEDDPHCHEYTLVEQFIARHGAMPLANLAMPKRCETHRG